MKIMLKRNYENERVFFFIYYHLFHFFPPLFLQPCFPPLLYWPNFFIYSFFCLTSVLAPVFQAVAVWLIRFANTICHAIKSEVDIWKVLLSVGVNEFSTVNYCLWKHLYVSWKCVIPLIRLYFVSEMMNNKNI